MKAQSPETTEGALKLAKRYESLLASMTNSNGDHGNTPNIFAGQVPNEMQNPEVQLLSPHTLRQQHINGHAYCNRYELPYREGIYCHGCGDEGHFRRECALQYHTNMPYGQPILYYPLNLQMMPVQMSHQLPMFQSIGFSQYQLQNSGSHQVVGQAPCNYSLYVPN